MVHVKDGLHFERADEKGSIRIVVKTENTGRILFETVLTLDEWASVIASCCSCKDAGPSFSIVREQLPEHLVFPFDIGHSKTGE